MKATRVFQLTALALVVVAAVQVGVVAVRSALLRDRQASSDTRQLYAQQVAAAQALLGCGRPAERVTAMLPGLNIVDQHVRARARRWTALLQEEQQTHQPIRLGG